MNAVAGDFLLVRGLAERRATVDGFEYAARDAAGSLIASLETEYSRQLLARAAWVTETFSQRDVKSLNAFFNERIGLGGKNSHSPRPAGRI
jgi:ABC-3C biological conflict system middle component